MNDAEAAQQLQTIRTLMERAALYRRALGPVLLVAGLLGVAAALVGWLLPVQSGNGFVGLWISVACIAIASSLIIIRRQSLQAAEAFWTPPTRRVATAMVPPLFAGLAMTLPLSLAHADSGVLALALPPVWVICYGLALHAAGFFTLRGIRWLGYAFVVFGALLCAAAALVTGFKPSLRHAHLVMGVAFGIGHLAAGLWLRLQERNSAA
jgi:hypothetical protein